MMNDESLLAWTRRAAWAIARLRHRRDVACVQAYLDDALPCLAALGDATHVLRGAPASPLTRWTEGVLAAVYESVVAFADEVSSVVSTAGEDLPLLPEIRALAAAEREGLVDSVRRARDVHGGGSRLGRALEGVALSLATTRRPDRRAAA